MIIVHQTPTENRTANMITVHQTPTVFMTTKHRNKTKKGTPQILTNYKPNYELNLQLGL